MGKILTTLPISLETREKNFWKVGQRIAVLGGSGLRWNSNIREIENRACIVASRALRSPLRLIAVLYNVGYLPLHTCQLYEHVITVEPGVFAYGGSTDQR